MEAETSAEVNEAIENSVKAPQLKAKENGEELPPQSGRASASENVTQDTAPMSPDTFMESLAGRGANFDQGSVADPGTTVEELTLNNYKTPSLLRGEGSSFKRGFWNNFTKLSGEPRGGDATLRNLVSIGAREDTRNSSMPQISMRMPSGSTQLEPNYSKVADHLAESDSRIASRSLLNKPSGGIRTKVLQSSGFSQILVKNSLRRKGVAYKHQVIHKEPLGPPQSQTNAARLSNEADVDINSSDKRIGKEPLGPPQSQNIAVRSSNEVEAETNSSVRRSGKEEEKALPGGGCLPLDIQHDELSLRDWLTPKHHKLDKLERLQIFKQILKVVDTAHSQGLVLQHLRPSYFSISPSNQVKYVSSFASKSQMEKLAGITQDIDDCMEHRLKRKKYWWHDYGASLPNHKSLGEPYKNNLVPGAAVFPSGCQQSASEVLKLEGIWYAGPEELSNNVWTNSSNIYNLGVIFFEVLELHMIYSLLRSHFLSFFSWCTLLKPYDDFMSANMLCSYPLLGVCANKFCDLLIRGYLKHLYGSFIAFYL